MIDTKIRIGLESDIDYVFSAWKKVMRAATHRRCPNDLFFRCHQQVISNILVDPKVKTLIACNNQDEDQIYGFIVGNADTLHFIYTKQIFRRLGIAKKLLDSLTPKGIVQFTQYPATFEKMIHLRDFVYNPYLIQLGVNQNEIRKEN